MLPKRWQGCILLLTFLVSNSLGSPIGPDTPAETLRSHSPSDSAKIIQSKQIKQILMPHADHQLLRALANTGVEVMIGIANDQIEHIGEFQEEADAWVSENILPFCRETEITYIMAGNELLTTTPANALLLVPAMQNLRFALATYNLHGRIKISSPMSIKLIPETSPPSRATFSPEWYLVIEQFLHFLKRTESSFFLNAAPSDTTDVMVDAAYNSMRALNFTGIPVITAGSAGLDELDTLVQHGKEDTRRALATGSAAGQFCVALQNANPALLQDGLNWACGPGGADCSAIQPGGPCYKESNLVALASYAYNDYYHKMATSGATCSFNGTATLTSSDPSSGSCVFAGSTMAGNSSITPTASPPTNTGGGGGGFSPPSLTPPSFSPPGFSPPTTPFGNGTPNTPFSLSPTSTFGPLSSGSSAPARERRVFYLVPALLLLLTCKA